MRYLMIKLLFDLLYSPPLAIVIMPQARIRKTINKDVKSIIFDRENIKKAFLQIQIFVLKRII